jgi:hypothetical protein
MVRQGLRSLQNGRAGLPHYPPPSPKSREAERPGSRKAERAETREAGEGRKGRNADLADQTKPRVRYLILPVCHDAIRHATTQRPRGDENISCSLLIIFQSKLRVCQIRKMMNPEYDFADEPEATNEKQADDQSTGDHSDEEGVQGPPPPTEFKRLLGEWAKDFEKLEAVAYHHRAAASEETSEIETKWLSDAVEAATSKEQNSLGLLQAFMGQSGDPRISATFREIQMEAVTLLSARNDATRRAARAKEAAELVASKQGLAKDPAALSAATKLFATCDDICTQIQTRVAKFIQNPLAEHQKTVNSSTLLNTIHASGLLTGSPANPGLTGLKTKLEDNVFNSGRISDATGYIKDYPGLQWPDVVPVAIALTRVEIPALRPGMVVPILRFHHGALEKNSTPRVLRVGY